MIYYGWGDVIRNKQFMGYQYCESCCDFKPYYLSKLVFRVHISYIPIFWKGKGYYITCNNCKRGRQLSKQDFRKLKAEYSPMKKSLAKKCYKEICSICDTLDGCNETNVNYVMQQLSSTYPITANETLRDHYHELISTKLLIAEQLKHPQIAPSTAPAIPQSNAEMDNINVWTCSCGAVNTTKYCSDCGAQQPIAQPAAAAAQAADPAPVQAAQPAAVTVCPRCGKEDMNAPFFCSACGSPMNR